MISHCANKTTAKHELKVARIHFPNIYFLVSASVFMSALCCVETAAD
jgi:hypothetical protein